MDDAHEGPAAGRAHSRSGTRETILSTATRLIQESGVRALTLDKVAAACGIAPSALTHHFASKDELLTALIARRDEVQEARTVTRDMPGREVLRAWVGLSAHNVQDRHMVELFAMVSVAAGAEDHPAHDFFAARYVALTEMLEGSFAQVKESGGLRDGVDPGVAAQQIVALTDGLQVQWMLDPSVDMPTLLRAHLDGQLVDPLDR